MALPSYNSSLISSVARVSQDMDTPQYLLGGRGGAGGTTYALSKKSTTHTFSVWRSKVFEIGKPFNILKIKIPIHPAVTTNMTIVPVLYFDNEQTSASGTTINSTNFSGKRLIQLTSKNFSNATNGKRNFFLELQFTGSALSTVSLPIKIDIETDDNI